MMDNAVELWQRYRQQNDRQAREELIIHYNRLVKYVVGRLTLGLPPSLQYEDLVGYGILGLIEAIDRFNPEQGVKFATYAVTRIRGQIIDSLRAMDLLPRSVYRHNREVESALAALSQEFGRAPEDHEVAQHLNISLEQYYGWLGDINFSIVSLDQTLVYDNGEEGNLYGSLEDTHMPSPSQEIDDTEMKAELIAAIRKLPQREQLMISLYYNDGLTMKEIGQVLDVSESRVSQIHARAVLTLRGMIKSRTEPNPVMYNRRGAHASVFAAAG
ncbi:MAG: RNA polymerase sigma-D factor [Anaerolineae bacterium]|nr:RNA polymerase sigma-D factor [Anaerolineae bacterium]